MNEDFVHYELAVKLKEKGFDYECIAHYDINKKLKVVIREPIFWHSEVESYLDAPTISQVLKWLREEKELHIEIYMYHNRYLWEVYNTKIYDVEFNQKSEKYSGILYKHYELAALAGIEYVIDNLI